MWKVEIDEVKVDVKEGVSARTGKPYRLREQSGWLFGFGPDGRALKHPQRVRITLEDEQPAAYPVGVYYVHPSSLGVGRFESPSVRLRLMSAADFRPFLQAQFGAVVGGAGSPASGPRAA